MAASVGGAPPGINFKDCRAFATRRELAAGKSGLVDEGKRVPLHEVGKEGARVGRAELLVGGEIDLPA